MISGGCPSWSRLFVVIERTATRSVERWVAFCESRRDGGGALAVGIDVVKIARFRVRVVVLGAALLLHVAPRPIGIGFEVGELLHPC